MVPLLKGLDRGVGERVGADVGGRIWLETPLVLRGVEKRF